MTSPGMNCPACAFPNPDGSKFCVRCRMAFIRRNLVLARFRDHLFWVFRRANAGFLSGLIAWFFIPALSRVMSMEGSAAIHFCLQGLLGGAFLGTVDGMIEESSPKTLWGGLAGALGGAIGGFGFGYYVTGLDARDTTHAIFLFWGFAGLLIGLATALWERRPMKLLAGGLSGLIGGGAGGMLGYAVFAYIDNEFHPGGWVAKRLVEGFSGGIIGITLWFSIGMAERFVIFRRLPLENRSYKPCDHCSSQNPLNAWYCSRCGSVIQYAAPAGALNLSPFTTLDRLRGTFRFLARLAATTGIIAGIVLFAVFVPIDPTLAFVSVVIVSAASYALLVLFSSVSESLSIFIKK